MALVREVNGALHISSRGRMFEMGLLWMLGAVLMGVAVLTTNNVPLFVYFLGVGMALVGALNLLVWAIQPRVIIEPRTRSVLIGKAWTPRSTYTGVVRVCEAPGVESTKPSQYVVYLVSGDGSNAARVRLAMTTGDETSQDLQYRVARMLEVPVLADE